MRTAVPSFPVRAVAWTEIIPLAAAAPFLLFPDLRPPLTAAALGLLGLAWLLRWAIRREAWPATPFNGALLLFALSVAVAAAVSALPELTIPKLTGVLLGLAAFRSAAWAIGDRRTLAWGLAAFFGAGLAILVVGLLATGWSVKVPLLAPVIDSMPQLLRDLPGAPDAGINANQLAGVLALYLPAVAGCAFAFLRSAHRRAGVLALAGTLLAGGALLLTQSRAGWIGAGAGLLALALLLAANGRRRRLRRAALIAVPVLALIAVALVIMLAMTGEAGPDGAGRVPVAEALGNISLSGRVEIWSRALYAIQDFPFTGTGLGTFRRVVHLLYPLFLIGPDVDIAHAHNIFLQVAVDVGLPGLVAYLALLWLAAVVGWRAILEGQGWLPGVACGLLGGLAGLHVYGLADALALGSKPGVAFWAALGLLAGIRAVSKREAVLGRRGSGADGPDARPVSNGDLEEVHDVVRGQRRPDGASGEKQS